MAHLREARGGEAGGNAFNTSCNIDFYRPSKRFRRGGFKAVEKTAVYTWADRFVRERQLAMIDKSAYVIQTSTTTRIVSLRTLWRKQSWGIESRCHERVCVLGRPTPVAIEHFDEEPQRKKEREGEWFHG